VTSKQKLQNTIIFANRYVA